MADKKQLNRRSFLGRVSGFAIAAGAVGAISTTARAATDSDVTRTGDPVGGGTDSDTGSYADPAGRGTDSDVGTTGDPANRGTGGVTDADTGSYADPVGRGRGGSSDPAGGAQIRIQAAMRTVQVAAQIQTRRCFWS